MNKIKKISISILVITVSLSFYFLKDQTLPYVDQQADEYFESVSTKAVSAYAVTRGVNAVVSVVKESQISVSPAGVGVTIAGGQVLDPLDDMTERLSSVIVLSIVSIGIQKVAMEIGQLLSFQVISFLFPVFLLPLWLPGTMPKVLGMFAGKVVVLLIILRVLLPGAMFLNDGFYKEFLETNITQTKQKLKIISESGDELINFETLEYQEGLIETINNSLDSVSKKGEQIRRLFNKIRANLADIIESLLDLTIAYVALFLVQVILIPLFVIWFALRIVDFLFKSTMRVELWHKVGGEPEKESRG